jgi:tetratricopeptide (TPR) repeat protein
MNNNEIEKLRELSFSAIQEYDYEKAISYRNEIIEQESADLGDYFFIGQWSVEINDYKSASEVLTQCINFGKENSRSWYDSSAYLLRAYALVKLNKLSDAMLDMEYIEENFKDCSITWLTNHPVIDLDYLKGLL